MLGQFVNLPIVGQVIMVVVVLNTALVAVSAFCQKLADILGTFCDKTGSDLDNKAKAALLKVVAALGFVLGLIAKVINVAGANGVQIPQAPAEAPTDAPKQ